MIAARPAHVSLRSCAMVCAGLVSATGRRDGLGLVTGDGGAVKNHILPRARWVHGGGVDQRAGYGKKLPW